MKYIMVKIIIVALLTFCLIVMICLLQLIVSFPLHAAEPDFESTPDNGELFDQFTNGDDIIPVTVNQMRNALWYYNNYFTVKERNDVLSTTVQEQLDALEFYRDENENLYKRGQFYTAGFWILIGTIITITGIVIYERVRK